MEEQLAYDSRNRELKAWEEQLKGKLNFIFKYYVKKSPHLATGNFYVFNIHSIGCVILMNNSAKQSYGITVFGSCLLLVDGTISFFFSTFSFTKNSVLCQSISAALNALNNAVSIP